LRRELRRHDLLRVRPEAWAGLLAQVSDERVATVSVWAEHAWPVMVRRYACAEPRAAVPIAIALPPALPGLKRPGLSLRLPAHAIAAHLPPVTLRSARTTAPAAWHSTIDALDDLAIRCRSVPTVFGSLLWQTLTGLPYLSAQSDLDLLWPIDTASQADELAAALAALGQRSGVPIDGEWLLPDGRAVSWREWGCPAGDEVLLKSLHAVERRPRGALFA
jgi:phosphoribosyl-dephospho-CoA transferase